MDDSAQNLQPFVELNQILQKLGYGTATVGLQVYKGIVTSLQTQEFKQLRFKDGENACAITELLEEIKKLADDKVNGNYTFTIQFNEGNIRKVFIQNNLEKRYPLQR